MLAAVKQVSEKGAPYTIRMAKQLDYRGLDHVRKEMDALKGNCSVVLDMSDTEILDRAGMGMLMLLHRRVCRKGESICMVNCRSHVQALLCHARIDRLFDITRH